MNILNKILNAIKEGSKELSQAIMDTEEANEFAKEIEESEQCLQEAKHDLTQVMAKEFRASKKLDETREQIKKNEIIVEHSLKHNDETMAMKIADEIAKLEINKNKQIETLESYSKHVKDLKKTMERAERQIKEYERQINMVDTTESVQKATQAITEKMNSSNSGITSAKEKLNQIKRKNNSDD